MEGHLHKKFQINAQGRIFSKLDVRSGWQDPDPLASPRDSPRPRCKGCLVANNIEFYKFQVLPLTHVHAPLVVSAAEDLQTLPLIRLFLLQMLDEGEEGVIRVICFAFGLMCWGPQAVHIVALCCDLASFTNFISFSQLLN